MSRRGFTARHPEGDGDVDARERILRTAYDLFSRHGLTPVGVDRITAESGTAKMTLYRHFRSKDQLVLAVLERHSELWTHGWLESEVQRRGGTGDARLLAIFDAFDDWFHGDYQGCLFTSMLIESHDRTSVVGAASTERLAEVRAVVRSLAESAGAGDAEALAQKVQGLMWGSINAAVAGDLDAAQRARDVATLLLEDELGRSG